MVRVEDESDFVFLDPDELAMIRVDKSVDYETALVVLIFKNGHEEELTFQTKAKRRAFLESLNIVGVSLPSRSGV